MLAAAAAAAARVVVAGGARRRVRPLRRRLRKSAARQPAHLASMKPQGGCASDGNPPRRTRGPTFSRNRARLAEAASRVVVASSFAPAPNASLSSEACRHSWIAYKPPPRKAETRRLGRSRRRQSPCQCLTRWSRARPRPPPAILYLATIEVPAAIGDASAQRSNSGVARRRSRWRCSTGAMAACEVFAHYAEAAARDALLALLGRGRRRMTLGALRIEQIADGDWVAQARGHRGQVAAGRFLVHGSHDRGKVPRGRSTLEIDAGLAFGTAHHAINARLPAGARRSSQAAPPKAVSRYRHRHRHPRHRRRQGACTSRVLAASDTDARRGGR